MANIINIILRAVCFGFLSSFSNAPGTWQKSHSTPSDAVMNCIAGMICSDGTPLSAWMFLKTCSAGLLGGLSAEREGTFSKLKQSTVLRIRMPVDVVIRISLNLGMAHLP